ncbi:MAG TPA: Bax inhibitor-1/YccA family protein [Flavobacteriales bacterium]|jgi:FtsH-binding integral membrane protein|nr:Bax inhibitor-1/YccA family protein [Flavobacteriales bacterium]MBK6551200.1 Bax inhibitor-1/YccA family protein [Flavobacteriales bacterium]MBK7102098.1 Bax inhibitor-1/YccA family protein [Flavobacteriales bacterium]MBK7112568.1 Bax inhibitor-1/YccA family protein [Flavobacteriales bacterium]MBK7483490.1 Bax inhibitor-1/YccA family protein [Flavobacteriales bacterium]
MEQTNFPSQQTGQVIYGPDTASSVRTFLSSVFSYMTMALVISGVMAWWFGNDTSKLQYLINFETGSNTILGWVVMFAPLGLVFVMAGMVNKMSSTLLLATFLVFSTVMGISLSYIFLIYSTASIANVFFISAAVFGVMAVAGYTTKTDLTKLGSILMIGLIGIIIASVVNMFLKSDTMGYIVSIIGVLIFTGLTAYDVQKLKRMGEQVAAGTETAQKMALMGALTLYLDFINLFLMLLRLFGGRRD